MAKRDFPLTIFVLRDGDDLRALRDANEAPDVRDRVRAGEPVSVAIYALVEEGVVEPIGAEG